MNEQELINGLKQVDAVIAECINPPLKRADHDNARTILHTAIARVQLSYKLEKEKQEAEKGREATEA